jgi:hypothetical protein
MQTPRVQIIEVPAYVAPGHPPATEWFVYSGDTLVRVCPSRGMAEEVAAGL